MIKSLRVEKRTTLKEALGVWQRLKTKVVAKGGKATKTLEDCYFTTFRLLDSGFIALYDQLFMVHLEEREICCFMAAAWNKDTGVKLQLAERKTLS